MHFPEKYICKYNERFTAQTFQNVSKAEQYPTTKGDGGSDQHAGSCSSDIFHSNGFNCAKVDSAVALNFSFNKFLHCGKSLKLAWWGSKSRKG